MAAGASSRMLDMVDPNVVLDHVDINALIDRVDLNDLLDRVDINELLDRVDINQLLSRADIDALMERVDVQALVERAGIPEIVAESTSHLGASALDLFRKPIIGLDEIIFRMLNRVIGRDPNEYPHGPGDLPSWVDDKKAEKAAVKTGRYGGPLTRLLAVLLDFVIITIGFALTAGGLTFLVRLFAPDFELSLNQGFWYGVALAVWAFLYLWLSLAVFGKTVGKTVLGLRVVGSDGSVALHGYQALVRTLTYPVSYLVLGLGLLGVIFNPERKAWHDHFARSAVVYDWGSRTAAMPTPLADYLERRGVRD